MNPYQGSFVLLRIEVITGKRDLTFCFPSKPSLLVEAPLRHNTRLLRLLPSAGINLPHWQ